MADPNNNTDRDFHFVTTDEAGRTREVIRRWPHPGEEDRNMQVQLHDPAERGIREQERVIGHRYNNAAMLGHLSFTTLLRLNDILGYRYSIYLNCLMLINSVATNTFSFLGTAYSASSFHQNENESWMQRMGRGLMRLSNQYSGCANVSGALTSVLSLGSSNSLFNPWLMTSMLTANMRIFSNIGYFLLQPENLMEFEATQIQQNTLALAAETFYSTTNIFWFFVNTSSLFNIRAESISSLLASSFQFGASLSQILGDTFLVTRAVNRIRLDYTSERGMMAAIRANPRRLMEYAPVVCNTISCCTPAPVSQALSACGMFCSTAGSDLPSAEDIANIPNRTRSLLTS